MKWQLIRVIFICLILTLLGIGEFYLFYYIWGWNIWVTLIVMYIIKFLIDFLFSPIHESIKIDHKSAEQTNNDDEDNQFSN